MEEEKGKSGMMLDCAFLVAHSAFYYTCFSHFNLALASSDLQVGDFGNAENLARQDGQQNPLAMGGTPQWQAP